MIVLNLLLIWLHFLTVHMMSHQQPVTQLKWKGKCNTHSKALNDCNWCRCGTNAEYICDARTCSAVDMFGHFNDAIQEFDPGMQGHGYWRSTKSACEPDVSYRRGGLLCICNSDGSWPNPVCRDIFRVLHEVEVTGITEADGQDCTPFKLYLVGCNVCFCPLTGQLSPQFCTNRKCRDDDPVLKGDEDVSAQDSMEQFMNELTVEIYASCEPDLQYKLGCQNCKCLRNNRLLCTKCDGFRAGKGISYLQSFCKYRQPGQTFSRDCNLCYCDKTGIAYCTVKNCLSQESDVTGLQLTKLNMKSDTPFEDENCTPGYLYKRSCNICYCIEVSGRKFFGCTLKTCGRAYSPQRILQDDCVKGTLYELNCLICTCTDVNGVKTQLCQVNPFCKGKKFLDESRTDDLNSLHGYCEPMHDYKADCNSCTCLPDGQTVRCTSYVCDNSSPDPVELEIIPVHQNGPYCPKGLSYKINCNYCFCLSNGNALCTTVKCR